MSTPPTPPAQPACIQVVFCDDFRHRLEAWLGSRGWVLARLPDEYQRADDLVSYVIVPAGDEIEAARRARLGEAT